MIYEVANRVEVDTPKGRGTVFLVTEYGVETPKLFTCIINATGEIWEFPNHAIRATKNLSFGRDLAANKTCQPPGYSQ